MRRLLHTWAARPIGGKRGFSGNITKELLITKPSKKETATFRDIDTSFVGSYVPSATPNPQSLTEVCHNILEGYKALLQLDPKVQRYRIPKLFKNHDGVHYDFEGMYMPLRQTYYVVADNFDTHKQHLADVDALAQLQNPELAARTLVALDATLYITRRLAPHEWVPSHRRVPYDLAGMTSAVMGVCLPVLGTLPPPLVIQLLSLSTKYGVPWEEAHTSAMTTLTESSVLTPEMARSIVHVVAMSRSSRDMGAHWMERVLERAMTDCANFNTREVIMMLQHLEKIPPGRREPWVSQLLRRAKIIFYAKEDSVASWNSDASIPLVDYWMVYCEGDRSKEVTAGLRSLEKQGDYKLQKIYPQEAVHLVTAINKLKVKNEDLLVCDMITRLSWEKHVTTDTAIDVAEMLQACIDLDLSARVPRAQFEEMIVSMEFVLIKVLTHSTPRDLSRALLLFSQLGYRPHNLHRMYANLAKGVATHDAVSVCNVFEAMARLQCTDETLAALYCERLRNSLSDSLTVEHMRTLSACAVGLRLQSLANFVLDRWGGTEFVFLDDRVCMLRVRSIVPLDVRPWDVTRDQETLLDPLLEGIMKVTQPGDVIGALASLRQISSLNTLLTDPRLTKKVDVPYQYCVALLEQAMNLSSAACQRGLEIVSTAFPSNLSEKALLEVLPLFSALLQKHPEITAPETLLDSITAQCIDLTWRMDQPEDDPLPVRRHQSAFEAIGLRTKRREDITAFVLSHLFRMGCKERADIAWNVRVETN